MINYEEELKKFEPCQDVDDAVDILKEILKETEGNTRKQGVNR